MTKQVSAAFFRSASKSELNSLIKARDLILEVDDLSPEEAFHLLAARLADIDLDQFADQETLSPDQQKRFSEATNLLEASLIVFS
jgi:hypothetical protein